MAELVRDYPVIIYIDGTSTYTYISEVQRDDPVATVAYWRCKRITNATGTWSYRVDSATGERTSKYIFAADTNGTGSY